MESNNDTNPHQAGYDKTDVNITKIVGYSFTVVVVLIAIVIFLYEVFVYSKEQAVYDVVLRPESKALRELRAREVQVLNSYKILSAEKQTYQIPIEQAMALLANESYQKHLSRIEGK